MYLGVAAHGSSQRAILTSELWVDLGSFVVIGDYLKLKPVNLLSIADRQGHLYISVVTGCSVERRGGDNSAVLSSDTDKHNSASHHWSYKGLKCFHMQTLQYCWFSEAWLSWCGLFFKGVITRLGDYHWVTSVWAEISVHVFDKGSVVFSSVFPPVKQG